MITVLTGENSFLLNAELRQRVTDFVHEHTDMGLERLDGEEASYDRMREAVESVPFLAPKKLVILDRPSMNKEFIEHAPTLLAALTETTDVILIEPKLDKRLTYYKFLKKQADILTYNELDEHGLARWLVDEATRRGGTLSLRDARYVLDRVGINQQLVSNELAKLLSYDPAITRQTIESLTDRLPQSSIFALLDAALAGDTELAMNLYTEQRALKVEPQQILAMLAWQVHVLALVKTAGQRDAAAIAREARLNPFVVRKSQAAAAKLSQAQLKQLVKRTFDLDILLKSEPLDADEALRQLLMTLQKTP